jgi:hypothetical protein
MLFSASNFTNRVKGASNVRAPADDDFHTLDGSTAIWKMAQ